MTHSNQSPNHSPPQQRTANHTDAATSFPTLASARSLPRPDLIDERPSAAFTALLKKHKISPDEYQTLRGIMGRAPTMAELGIFSAMWSEHCSYKSSRVHLRRFPTKGPNVVVGPGENAGVVRLHGKLCAAFKMESHNHPSYIEPYQGAATGVGGILRDVFCMGARPVANLDCLRFGARSHARTPYLFDNVVKGVGDYGNCIGVPTVGGSVSFDATYDGNILVNAMTVGLVHEDKIFKGYASGQGNLVVYVGSATGRDGIHGATMASDSFATDGSQERSTVQVGDPYMEKLLLEATLEVLEKGLVIGLQDMGAAGLTSSSFEMAGRAGNGLYLDLDRVPVRAQAMTAYELLLSESQERMLMVIEPGNWEALSKVLERWGLAYDVIGVVTDSGRVQASRNGLLEIDVPVAPLTEKAPLYERPVGTWRGATKDQAVAFDDEVSTRLAAIGSDSVLTTLLRETGFKTRLIEQYDQHIGTKSVHGPASDGAAVLWLRSELTPEKPFLGLAAVAGCNERYCAADPRLGAAHAVARAARMIVAAGGEPLAITDCLNYGNPEDPQVMAQLALGVDGISEACRELAVPVVSGNVSLYNETDGTSIAPTPMIGMVGRVDDVRRSTPAVLTAPAFLYALRPKQATPTLGASLAAKCLGRKPHEGLPPPIDWQVERESMQFLRRLHEGAELIAARDVGAGGFATAVAKLCLGAAASGGPALGCDVELRDLNEVLPDAKADSLWYFGELSGAYVLAFASSEAAEATRAYLPPSLELISLGRAVAGDLMNFGSFALTNLNACTNAKESLSEL